MKVLINENTENKLHSFYQNKIDDEWNVLKQRYKDEGIIISGTSCSLPLYDFTLIKSHCGSRRASWSTSLE